MPFQKETKGWATFISPSLIMARAEMRKSLSHCSLSLAPLKMHHVLMERNPFQQADLLLPAMVCWDETCINAPIP